MASSKRTESDLTSVSSGLSTAPDEPTTNGKPKTTKAKSTKSAPVKKAKAQSASTASTKKAVTIKNGTAKDSGRPVKDMSKAKPNGKGKGKAVVEEVEKIEKRQRTYGLLSEDQIDYQEDEDIKSDWQVPYVWAFLVKFCKDAIKGLCVVDDLEEGLKSMGPHDGIAEALAALLKGVQGHNPGAKPKNDPNPDDLAVAVKKLLDKKLVAGSPLTVFDSYVYEVKSYVTKEQNEASASTRKEQDPYRDIEATDVQEDRRHRNPLASHGFWAVTWQARLKILRQLVDWTLTTKGPVREALDFLYAPKKNRPVTTEYSCDIEGLKDGNKRHIYRVDASYRTYAANKMYHMGTPLYTLTSTKEEYENLITEYKAAQDVLDQMQKGGKKNAPAKRNAEANVKVAERLEEDLPKIEEAEAEIVRAKERYQKAQIRKLRALAQLEASSFALTTRSRTRKVVNYNETQAEDEFEEEEDSREYQSKRQGRSSTNSSFRADSTRGVKRDYEEVDSAETSEAAIDESRNSSRPSKRTRRVDSAESEASPVEIEANGYSPVEPQQASEAQASESQAPESQAPENELPVQHMSE